MGKDIEPLLGPAREILLDMPGLQAFVLLWLFDAMSFPSDEAEVYNTRILGTHLRRKSI